MLRTLVFGSVVAAVVAHAASARLPAQQPPRDPARNRSDASERLCLLFPSRVKTAVKASYDPDDRPHAPGEGNDDGFSGTNQCEAYRFDDNGTQVAVLAHFEGRAGVMGLFFRNFWSDPLGLPMSIHEANRTRIWIDGAVAHDLPLPFYFRNENGPGGQIAPFDGPFTGHRSGGHFTHAQLRWNDSFKIGLDDDAFANAARFHRVAATLASPEDELPVPDQAGWEWIAKHRGQWPHRSPRLAQTTTLALAGNGGRAHLALPGPQTLLELTFTVPARADWRGLWARFTWDRAPRPQVEVPLRLLGAMVVPPYQVPMDTLLASNDGDRRVSCWFPMPFARCARLELENRNANGVAVDVTVAAKPGVPDEAWGYFTSDYHAWTTELGEAFRGPHLTDCRGLLRFLMLEENVDSTGRIPNQLLLHLEGDLCIRVNGNRGDDHTFDASETSIGRWGWYSPPVDQRFCSDTSFQSGALVRLLGPGVYEGHRVMGSTFVFDPVHFVNGIDVLLEHGVQNTSNADYALLAFLYVQPGAARRVLDEIDVGDTASEQARQLQFTAWSTYTRTGSFLRDQFYGTPPVTDSVRDIRDYLRFRVARSTETPEDRAIGLGFRLDRLGSQLSVCQADVFVEGQPAGLLHSFSHNAVFPWKEGGECEVELPRALTDGRASFTVEVRPRPGSDPLKVARIWVYEYTK